MKKILKITGIILLILLTSFILLGIFLPEVEKKPDIKTISQEILTTGDKIIVDYDANKWIATSGGDETTEGDEFGYYSSGILLKSKKTYTDYENTEHPVYPVYEISLQYVKNINAYVHVPKPGDPDFTGAGDNKPEPPQPFKKDDFILVNTVNGKNLYISKTGSVIYENPDLQIAYVDTVPFGGGGVVQEYVKGMFSGSMDLFSKYEDVFNGKESFGIGYDVNENGTWEELKPELIKILKSFRIEKTQEPKTE